MEPDESRQELAALKAFTHGYGPGRWRVWRNNGVFYAWLQPPTSPPIVLRAWERAALEDRVAEFERVLANPDPAKRATALMQALAAAERLDT